MKKLSPESKAWSISVALQEQIYLEGDTPVAAHSFVETVADMAVLDGMDYDENIIALNAARRGLKGDLKDFQK